MYKKCIQKKINGCNGNNVPVATIQYKWTGKKATHFGIGIIKIEIILMKRAPQQKSITMHTHHTSDIGFGLGICAHHFFGELLRTHTHMYNFALFLSFVAQSPIRPYACIARTYAHCADKYT